MTAPPLSWWAFGRAARAEPARGVAPSLQDRGARCKVWPRQPTARRRREPSRLCSTLSYNLRARRSRVPREHRLILGGRSWYVAPRPPAEGEGPIVGAVSFPSEWANHNQRGTTREHQARVLHLLPRNSKRSGALTRATHNPADSARPKLVCRTTAARRRREASCRCSVLAYCMGRPQPARHCARATSSRAAPPPEKQQAQCRARVCHAKAG